ncbi:hypothetical protein PG984_003746 [Apiospora sp. TS-2023a]
MAPLSQPATEAKVDTRPNKKQSNGLPAKPPPVKAHVPPAKKNWETKKPNQNQTQNKAVPEVRPYFPPSKASGGGAQPHGAIHGAVGDSAHFVAGAAPDPSGY